MDNLTIVVPVKRRGQEIAEKQELLHNGTSRPAAERRRTKVKEPSGGNLRVQWVKVGKEGEGLKIEGSFPLFLQGHNVLCSTDIQAVVPAVVYRVLALMGIEPTPQERRLIDELRIKVDRVDVVGWISIRGLTPDVGLFIEALNYGLKASRRPCMYFPRETLVWNATNRNWSLMFYDKAAQLQAKQAAARKREEKGLEDPDVNIWDNLHPDIQVITRTHLRVELRVLRNQLKEVLEIEEVRQLDSEVLKGWVKKRVAEMVADLRLPMPPIPVRGVPITRALAVGLLRQLGIDLVAGMTTRPRQRLEKELKETFDVRRIHQAGLEPKYTRFVESLSNRRNYVRFNAPRSLGHHIHGYLSQQPSEAT